MQEREHCTVFRVKFVASGHFRQRPVRFFRGEKKRRVSSVAESYFVFGILDTVVVGAGDNVATLLDGARAFADVEYVLIANVEDAHSLNEWSSSECTDHVNALCYGHNEIAQLARIIPGLVDYIPLLEPVGRVERIPGYHPLLRAQEDPASKNHDDKRTFDDHVMEEVKIVRCVLTRAQPGCHYGYESRGQPPLAATIDYPMSFTTKSIAIYDRIAAELVRLEEATTLAENLRRGRTT